MAVSLRLYRFLTWVGLPLVEMLLRRRINRGREDVDRLAERRGMASKPRPPGQLLWIHAASVGEATSCLLVIERLLQQKDNRTVLLTTGTVTSARMVVDRLPANAIHQYYPVDRAAWVARFLDHWRPDAAIWVESEFWPNMILQASHRNIPLALINGRMSVKSEENWRYAGSAIKELLCRFSVCLAQTPQDAECFRRLGAKDADCVGNLKYSALPPPASVTDVASMKKAVSDRPVWLAASTHPGDEDIALETHHRLREKFPDLLTIIALRHPERLDEVLGLPGAEGLSIACRSRDTVPTADTSVFIVDTVGEMGIFYRSSPVVLVCGSFSDRGGHNPIEPAVLDCVILHGPDMRNFVTVAEDMKAADAAFQVNDGAAVADTLASLLLSPNQMKERAAAARKVAGENNGVIDRVMERIDGLIPGGDHG